MSTITVGRDEPVHGWNRLVRPPSVPTRGHVFLGMMDVTLRREAVAALWLAGIDVEEVCGLGVLCARLVGAPYLGPAPDVVVWDTALGAVAELDAVWRRYGDGPSPALVLVSNERTRCPQGEVRVCRRDPVAILRGVESTLLRLEKERNGGGCQANVQHPC
jgi:hypothetical protein